jgi:hypothetical protein
MLMLDAKLQRFTGEAEEDLIRKSLIYNVCRADQLDGKNEFFSSFPLYSQSTWVKTW